MLGHTPSCTPTTITVPDKPALEGLEEKYSQRWREQGTYAFQEGTPREQVYSIDTPPPTASGSLHVGHMFSYTQTDVIARYQRMTGKNVFYPMGWDDNGLPTERRVQNYYGVRCDPTKPYIEGYTPPAQPAKNQRDWDVVSRKNFIELCEELAVEDEKVFEDLFTRLGLSVDWSMTYRTIDDVSRAVSQRAFLRNVAAGDAYLSEAPTMWDVTFRTAVAQAELEDREVPGAYHRYAFTAADGEQVFIETTRPELLPACVALVAHPDDERYQELFGTTVRSPLFDVEVEVKAHHLAKPDKGSGIAMICTFGDLTDVTWWRELELPTRALIGRDGRFLAEQPSWIADGAPAERYANVAGKTVFSAQQAVVEMLTESGDLEGEPKKITHPVNFYEKGDKPLEVVTSRQWYIRNGGRDASRREKLIERGREIEWHPSFMRSRYENWIEGLNGDWLVSRQRFFGVPIPVWYPLDAQGEPVYDSPVLPDEAALPVDPAAQPAPGYTEDQRDQPGGVHDEEHAHAERGPLGDLGAPAGADLVLGDLVAHRDGAVDDLDDGVAGLGGEVLARRDDGVGPGHGVPVCRHHVVDCLVVRSAERRGPVGHVVAEEQPPFDVGEVPHQPQQVRHGRHARGPHRRFADAVHLSHDARAQVVQEPDQHVLLGAPATGWRGVTASHGFLHNDSAPR